MWREASERARRRASGAVRRAAGLQQDPPARCADPLEAYGDVYGVARVVHGDLPSMLIGGVASLLIQMLHPLAMAGVAEHSRYQDDPLGRLLQTANFISATTYGSTTTAKAAIARVQHVHDFVHGTTEDGVAYDANDPHLLLWIHCCETAMFLGAYRRFGARRLSPRDEDRYVEEMAQVARDFGVESPPLNVHDLDVTLNSFRDELRLTRDGAIARDFIATSVVQRHRQRAAHYLIVRSAWTVLTPWSRVLLEVRVRPLTHRLLIAPATALFVRAVRLAVPAPPQMVRDSPPSTTTT